MFTDRHVLCALETKMQIISVYYKATCSVSKQHTEYNDYLHLKYLKVSTNFAVIQTAGCTVATLDNVFIITCPVCVQEG